MSETVAANTTLSHNRVSGVLGHGSSLRTILLSFRLALREKKMVAVLATAVLVYSGSNAGVILYIREYLNGLLEVGTLRAVWIGAAVLLGLWMVRTASGFAVKVGRFRLARAIELYARVDVLAHLMRLSVGFLETHSRAELIQRVNNDTAALRQAMAAFVNSVMSVATIVGLVVVAAAMDPFLTILSLAVFPLSIPLLFLVGRKVEAAAGGQRQATVKLVDLLVEMLNGIRAIKAYNGEEREKAFHRKACREIYTFTGRNEAWQVGAMTLPELALGIGLVVVVGAGGLRILEGGMEWPALLAFIIALLGLQGVSMRRRGIRSVA